MLKKLARTEPTQAVLVMMGDALTGESFKWRDTGAGLRGIVADHEERVGLFLRTVEEDPELPYGPLVQ
jgi:hypothetical protein